MAFDLIHSKSILYGCCAKYLLKSVEKVTDDPWMEFEQLLAKERVDVCLCHQRSDLLEEVDLHALLAFDLTTRIDGTKLWHNVVLERKCDTMTGRFLGSGCLIWCELGHVGNYAQPISLKHLQRASHRR